MAIPADKEIGRIIRHRRWMIGMTQQQLADRVGVSLDEAREFESGVRPMGYGIALHVAESVDLPPSALCAGDGSQMRGVVLTQHEAAALVSSYVEMPQGQILGTADFAARTLSCA